MKLQVALDRLNYEDCFELISQLYPHLDIIEIGTGVIKEFGLGLVRDMKNKYPTLKVMADVKICDAGNSESYKAFEYGADIITVMSFASPQTISDCIDNANIYNGEVVVDLLNNHSPKVLSNLNKIGAKSMNIHIGKDQQQNGKFDLSAIKKELEKYNFKKYVAGGINQFNLEEYLEVSPDVVIVGSGIVKNDNPAFAAKTMQMIIKNKKV